VWQPQYLNLSGLKPHRFHGVYVVAKATTHKYSVVAKQALRSSSPTQNVCGSRLQPWRNPAFSNRL